MIGFDLNVGDFNVLVGNLGGLVDDLTIMNELGGALAEVLFDEVGVNVSYVDHTLADLRRLDHPYARRHGSIKTHGEDPNVVHTRSGEMYRSLKVEKLPSSNSVTGEAWTVWFDISASEHAKFVVLGTKYMLPRDVLWATTKDPRVQKRMMQAAVATLGKKLRTKANVRFSS